MIKKTILMLLVLVGGVMSANADNDPTYFVRTSTNSWGIQGQMTDDDGDGIYSLIVDLPTQNMYFTIFNTDSELNWGNALRPISSNPWITNSLNEISMLEPGDNGYTDNGSICYPTIDTNSSNKNFARAIRIDYNPSTRKMKVTRLIVVASGYNGWSTTTDYIEETSCGSKVYKGNVTLQADTPNKDDGFKFVYINAYYEDSNLKVNVDYGANKDGKLSNQASNYDVSADGVYELKADFGSWDWTDPTLIKVTASLAYPYATFSSDYALDFENVTAVKAYSASMDGTKVLMTRVSGKVPANTGLFLASASGQGANAEIPTTICTTELTGNLMKASTGEAIVSDNLYSFVKRGDDYGFTKVPSGYTWAKGKAYLETSSTVNAPSLSFGMDDDETTTIHSIDAYLAEPNLENGQVFDLQGRRVAEPTKGVYIVNGKKVIVK